LEGVEILKLYVRHNPDPSRFINKLAPTIGAESYTAGTAKAVPVSNLARLTMLRAMPLFAG